MHVVDLGCGIGASLCYLAQRLPIRGTGITLSPTQAAIGQQRIADLGLDDRVTCLEGDYTDLPPDLGPADVAFAIESFLHAPDPSRFFAEAARLLGPGGALIIRDDMARDRQPRSAEGLERFVRGWHVNRCSPAIRCVCRWREDSARSPRADDAVPRTPPLP